MSAKPLTDSGPLSGLRVVEFSRYVQGPIAALILAELGADVIKIEHVGSADPMRSLHGMSGVALDEKGRNWIYGTLNRGKRAIALDVSTESGSAVLSRLICQADVFVTNFREQLLTKVGADYATLSALNPRLVYGQGGGFGFEGALAEVACQDTSGMAYSGLMDLLSANGEPNYPLGNLSDVLTGTNLASAVLAGLARRSLTGEGSLARTSQLQTLLWLQMLPIGMSASLGLTMPRHRPGTPNPVYTVYPTSDGWISVAAINQAHWVSLATALDLTELLSDPRYSDLPSVERNGSDLVEILERAFRSKTTEVWCRELQSVGVWSAPVNRFDEMRDNEQVLSNKLLHQYPDGIVGVPMPFFLDNWHANESVAGEYGTSTDEVLTELGYDEKAILELRLEGSIW